MLSADLTNSGKHALTYGISVASPTYGTGFRLGSLGIDTSRRPYITLDDGAATHNCIKFGTGNDISMYFDATNLLMVGASERVGKFTLDNIELNIGEFHSTTQGSALPLSSTYTSAFRVYGDDDGTASTSGSVPDIAVGKFRYLNTKQNSNHLRHYGVMGHVKGYDSDWDTEVTSGVYGYLELVRNTATLSFGAHGISAAVMGCVETAGNMTVAANHILCGFSAISKLSYSGTLTMTGDSAAYHCGIYDSTNWSDSPSLDKWKFGLFVEGDSAIVGGLIGKFAGSAATTSAIPFATAQNIWSDGQLTTFEVHGSSASNLTSAYCAKVGRFRHVVTLTSSGAVAHETYGLMGQCVVKEATLQHLHAGLIGTFEGHTSGVVINGSYAYGVAGVMARVGGGGAITATKPVCGMVSFWNGAALAGGSSIGFGNAHLTTAWTYGFANAVGSVVHDMKVQAEDAGSLPCVIHSGAATDDAGIVSDVGADSTIADGSLYISVVDGAGKLFQKQNDIWVDLQA